MRLVIACSVLVLAACGGQQKHASSEADTSSLESGGSDPPVAKSAPSDSSGADTPNPTNPTNPTNAAPASSSSTSSSAASPPAAAAFHPTPGATGSIDGQPFAPTLAQVTGPLQQDGRVMVMLTQASDCVAPSDAKAGDGSMLLMVPWQDGYKADLGSLKRAKGKDKGEAAFIRMGSDGKGHVAAAFKPTGRITIVSAPTAANAFGKMKIDLSSGDYILAGDLDVKVCTALK
jgi:hypothetical protein